MKLTFLFWNIRGNDLSGLLRDAVSEHDVDVLVLAENTIPVGRLLNSLNAERPSKLRHATSEAGKTSLYARLPRRSVRPLWDARGDGLTIYRLLPPLACELLLVTMHLPSKLYQEPPDQLARGCRIARYIDEAEDQVGHSRTLVVGDFNCNPFEDAVVAGDALHAVMTRDLADEGTRQISGHERRLFYNPMWACLGDATPGPPGTYYYRGSGQVEFFWHMFDQVLLRSALLPSFRPDRLRILDRVGDGSLLGATGRPNQKISDHLPVLLTLDL